MTFGGPKVRLIAPSHSQDRAAPVLFRSATARSRESAENSHVFQRSLLASWSRPIDIVGAEIVAGIDPAVAATVIVEHAAGGGAASKDGQQAEDRNESCK